MNTMLSITMGYLLIGAIIGAITIYYIECLFNQSSAEDVELSNKINDMFIIYGEPELKLRIMILMTFGWIFIIFTTIYRYFNN